MVTQQILVLFFRVRVLVTQQKSGNGSSIVAFFYALVWKGVLFFALFPRFLSRLFGLFSSLLLCCFFLTLGRFFSQHLVVLFQLFKR